MKALFKKFSAVFLAVCTVAALVVFAACDNGGTQDNGSGNSPSGDDSNNAKITYTVTVTCEENPTILKGVKVRLNKADGSSAGESALSGGKASFTLEKGSYSVVLVEIIDGIFDEYVYAQKTVTESAPSVTVDLVTPDETGETLPYTVTVLMPNSSPAANLTVQLCGGPKGMCNTARTNENGVASFNLPAGDYEVHIDPPDGYAFDNTQYKMTEEGGALTVSLTAK